jgi:hypothetical protein
MGRCRSSRRREGGEGREGKEDREDEEGREGREGGEGRKTDGAVRTEAAEGVVELVILSEAKDLTG